MKKLVIASVAAAAAALTTVPASAQEADASVVVVHGIPDTTVDVYVDDQLTLDDFTFGTVTEPVSLPSGDHAIAVRAGDADPSAAPLLSADATLPAGADVSVVAHLDESGDPTLTPFVNDVTPVAAGEGRLVVRHTAAAPAVDVLAGGTPVFTNLANPNEAKADLPAGTVSASVALAGTTEPVIGPADVPVAEGAATTVYAVGSAEAGNLQVLSHQPWTEERQPCDIPTRPRKARDETISYRIAHGGDDDWDRGGRLPSGASRRRIRCDDDIGLEADELGCQSEEPVDPTVRRSVVDNDVSTF